MKVKCPLCGGEFELERASRDVNFRKILEMAHRFGDRSRLVWEYLDCFRRGLRPVPLKTELRLIEQLWEMWEGCTLIYDRRNYNFPRPLLVEAMETICTKQLVGLPNHNYLKRVVIGAVDRGEARQERQAEARKAGGQRDLMAPSPVAQLRQAATGDPRDAGDRDEVVPMPPGLAEAISKIGRKL